MKKYLMLIFVMLICFTLIGCKEPENPGTVNPPIEEHDCYEFQSEWIDDEPFTCGETGYQHTLCTKCGELVEMQKIMKRHEYNEEIVKEATCTEDGITKRTCINCNLEQEIKTYRTGHEIGGLAITKQPTASAIGQRAVKCKNCDEVLRTLDYVNNAYNFNGKLSVDGANLVNKSASFIIE